MNIDRTGRTVPKLAWAVLNGTAALLALTGCGGIQTAPAPRETVVIGPFAGHDARLHPDNLEPRRIQFYGTDLGWTYQHQGEIHILFGDTWATEFTPYIEESSGRTYDDGFGTIDLGEWPDASLISPGNIPLIKYGQNRDSAEMSAIHPGYAMEAYKTPVGGFSNGARQFGMFYVAKPQACRHDGDCSNGLRCDQGLGYAGRKPQDREGVTLPCIDGTEGCNTDPMEDGDGTAIEGSGLCIDAGSSNWAPTTVGRTSAMGMRHLVGIRSLEDPRDYTVFAEWLTTRFINPALRTVETFIPERGADLAAQDYRTARGNGPNRRVFLWGRPNFVGVGATGRDLALYFAYADMPVGPDYAWRAHYFSGTQEDGAPRFSELQSDAAPLDLDSMLRGIQSHEPYDIVDQMSIAWVEPLKKWVMFYGGGMVNVPNDWLPHCGLVEFFTGKECDEVVVGNGAVRMRSADQPWGPWTPPQDVFVGGDPNADPLQHQYADGGVLYHHGCAGARCAMPTGERVEDDYGWLYGANIIAEWIVPAGQGVDIFWNASTSNPYRVVLLKTRIE